MTSPPLDSTHGQQRRAWHDITALGQHTWSSTSGVACHHRPWTAHTVGNVVRGMTSPPLDSTHNRQRRAWHDITALDSTHDRQRRSWHDIIALRRQTWSNDVGHGMPSSPLGSTEGRTALGVACHHRLWPAHTVERRWAWHDLTVLGQHTRSDYVGRGLPSSRWVAHTVERRRVWHAIIALRQHTWSNDVGSVMKSPPLGSTHGRTTSGVA